MLPKISLWIGRRVEVLLLLLRLSIDLLLIEMLSPTAFTSCHPFGDTRAERAVVVTSDTLRANRGAYTARGQSHLKLNE